MGKYCILLFLASSRNPVFQAHITAAYHDCASRGFIWRLSEVSILSSDGFTTRAVPEWGDLVNETTLKTSLQPVWSVQSAADGGALADNWFWRPQQRSELSPSSCKWTTYTTQTGERALFTCHNGIVVFTHRLTIGYKLLCKLMLCLGLQDGRFCSRSRPIFHQCQLFCLCSMCSTGKRRTWINSKGGQLWFLYYSVACHNNI